MRRLLALCAVVTLIGCNSTENPDVGFVLPPTDANVAGTFSLASANGFVPPFDVVVNTQERNEGALALYLATGFELEPTGLTVLRRDLVEPAP